MNNLKEVTVSQARVSKRNSGKAYVNQTDFGKNFQVDLSNISVGKLLRIVGLAWKDRKATTPKIDYSPTPHYIVETHIDYYGTERSIYLWHYEKCLKGIDKWLKEKRHYDNFYSCETQLELKNLIDRLVTRYL